MNKKFATAINCIDGRTQEPVINYMKNSFNINYVDMITEPGPNKVLAENTDIDTIESLKDKVKISIEKHNSQLIAVVGHYDCAANTADDDTQRDQLKQAKSIVSSWGFNVEIIALWLGEGFKPNPVN